MMPHLPAITVTLLAWFHPDAAHPSLAYLGPGGAVSAIGAVLAAVAGLLIAILGFLWYPIKRLLRKRPRTDRPDEDNQDA